MGVTQILKLANNTKVSAKDSFIVNTAQYTSSTVLGKYRVTIVVADETIMESTLDNTNWFTLNQGEALRPKQLYVFDIPISPDDVFNVRVTTTTNIVFCRIDRVLGEG